MGCTPSKKCRKKPRFEHIVLLASETIFSINEVEALYVLYQRLSTCIVDDGLIHKDELQKAILGDGGKSNLFVDRVFDLFDLKHNGVIEFEEFVRSLSVFHPNTPEADKISFAFKLYDLRQTGYIERQEVKEMLLAVLKETNLTLSEDVVEAMIQKTFVEADLKVDGRIDEEEWKEFVSKNQSLMKYMTLPYLRDVSTTFPSFVFNTEAQDSELS